MFEDRRLAAIMFTDIVGYTSVMGSDEDKAFQILKTNRKIHNLQFERYNGTLIKEMGDGILASFPSALKAVQCAIAIQEEAKLENILLRIGIHEADVVFEGGDVFGDGVNVASRLEELAQEGDINISGTVYKEIKNKAGIKSEFIQEKILKNLDEPVKIYKVEFEERYDKPTPNTKIKKKKSDKKLLYFIVGVLVVIIASILIWYNIPKQPVEELEKSIAILPLKSLSDDPEKQYLADGVMDAITGHLSKISELRVIPRTSVEQYRGTLKTASIIGKELKVSYLILGSFQMYENKARLTVQLVNAKEESHEWFKEYDREWKDIFEVQSDVAQDVANEIRVIITPEEKQIIETIPTTNLTAYDFFMRARDAHIDYWLDKSNKNALEKAIILYYKALENDSSYAQAYTGLAWAYYDKYWSRTFFEEDYMDSVLNLVNTALSYDDQLEEAYSVRGIYYFAQSEYEKELIDLDKVLQINPNNSLAYYQKGRLHKNHLINYVEALKNLHKAASLDHSLLRPEILRTLSSVYDDIGFTDKSYYFIQEAFKLDGDSLKHFQYLAFREHIKGDIESSLEILKKSYDYDSTKLSIILNLIQENNLLGNYQEAYYYAQKLIELIDTEQLIVIVGMHRLGYTFWQVGEIEKGKYYFDKQIKFCLESIRLNRGYSESKSAHYDLAGIYAFLGEKEKTYQYLDEFDKKSFYPLWWINLIKFDPLFNGIREEERFQQIIQNMEEKNQKEHERVEAWSKEEMLF